MDPRGTVALVAGARRIRLPVLTRSLALEPASGGVRVNAVPPGPGETIRVDDGQHLQ